ncbi:MAG: hypothetical protein QM703_13435 [Gemmatales bacterium]
MRLCTGFFLLVVALLFTGCSDSKKFIQATDTVTAESIKQYGTNGGLGKPGK